MTGGGFPDALAFDGINLWAINSGNGTLSKVSARTGSFVGTYSLPANTYPEAIAFDQPGFSAGTNSALDSKSYVWTANEVTLSKVDVATGAVVANYPANQAMTGIVFDGTYIWACSFNSGTIVKIQAR